ncbi:MAG: KamA family radical SAM protein [Acidobacteria bacterium]|nr:KamA family radical SAM protein [Acidobacteriota bacterium]
MPIVERFTRERFQEEGAAILSIIRDAASVDEARRRLYSHVTRGQFEKCDTDASSINTFLHVVRDCARALRGMVLGRSSKAAGFSVEQALWDIARGNDRPDLQPGFYAELIHMCQGLEGRVAPLKTEAMKIKSDSLEGREAAIQRSKELDQLWAQVEMRMSRYEDGLTPAARRRRSKRRARIQSALGGTRKDFNDWKWQVEHIARSAEQLEKYVPLTSVESKAIKEATRGRLPFGVTPYYASLFDEGAKRDRDRTLRAQVLPPPDYVARMLESRDDRGCAFDFMLERDTSPIDLITRRYPAIAILKPYNTCPQICVYCQRNWEIDDAMIPDALAGPEELDAAIDFIAKTPALKEILVTGGDPFGMPDETLFDILNRLAAIPHIDLIRIGTRTPVTLPMRITPALVRGLGKLRKPGRREICLVTHVEHPYEITPEMVAAVDRLKRQGISVFNQNVYSFYVSRRFEAAKLRMILRRIGIDPYYTFMTKGKEETRAYRVPLARLLQEQKEEARLLPGSRRTDEAVYNVPGLGKNYLRAFQHRDLLAIMPDGARVYNFHPWEKGIADRPHYVGYDVPLLQYLARLESIGEDADDYESIWYYY